MVEGRGFEARAAFQREALVFAPTWPGTAIAATGVLPFAQHSVKASVSRRTEYATVPGGVSTTSKRAGGALAVPAYYEGLEFLWLACLGFQPYRISNGTPQPENLAGTAYQHHFELDTAQADRWWGCGEGLVPGDIDTGQIKVRRGTLAVDKQSAVWEHRSCLVQRMQFQADPRAVTLNAELVGYDEDLASSINTAASLALLSDQTTQVVRFHESVFRLATFSASSGLVSGDALAISSTTLAVDHGLTPAVGTSLTGLFVGTPERAGQAQATLSLTAPRHSLTSAFTRLDAGTELMADLVFTGPQIGATGVNYRLSLFFPSLRVTDADAAILRAGLIPERVTFLAADPTIAPAGMPATFKNRPVMAQVVSEQSSYQMF